MDDCFAFSHSSVFLKPVSLPDRLPLSAEIDCPFQYAGSDFPPFIVLLLLSCFAEDTPFCSETLDQSAISFIQIPSLTVLMTGTPWKFISPAGFIAAALGFLRTIRPFRLMFRTHFGSSLYNPAAISVQIFLHPSIHYIQNQPSDWPKTFQLS